LVRGGSELLANQHTKAGRQDGTWRKSSQVAGEAGQGIR
jgi:hypothetical protein